MTPIYLIQFNVQKSVIREITKNFLWMFLVIFLLSGPSVLFAQVTSITASNIPILVIDPGNTEIANEPKIAASFKIVAPDANGFYSYRSSSLPDQFQFEGTIGIEIRGNTSTEWPKKSYGFEMRDPVTADNIDVSLLGMPAESDWVLNACYGDKSFVREVLAQEMYRQSGRYAPRTRYVEVFLRTGGSMSYRGVYILMEKIKRGKDRINIKKLEETDTAPAKITGGFILQVGENEDMKWTSSISPNNNASNAKPIFHVEYPKLQKYTNTTVRDQQFNYIKNYVNNFEQAINGASYKDPTTGYRAFLNVDSMVDYLLLQEFTKNSDNWRASTFFYKQRDDEGGLLNMGAPWDFDKSMGNQQWCYEPSVLPTGTWAWKFNTYCTDRPPFTVSWPERVVSDCYFVQKIVTRYRELRQDLWSDAKVSAFIDAQYATLSAKNAMDRNFTKWPILSSAIMYNEHYTLSGNTHLKEVEYLKTWMQQHLAWMDANITSIGTTECQTALPVTFNNFEVKKKDQQVLVSWSTVSERNNKLFEIERSSDGILFSQIGLVEGRGDSEKEIKYLFTDTTPLSGLNYYRIKQTDFDGTAQFTRIAGIDLGSIKTAPVIYPNPTNNEINLKDLVPGSTITILNSKGQILHKTTAASTQDRFDLRAYPSQIYYITIDDKEKVRSYTFVLDK